MSRKPNIDSSDEMNGYKIKIYPTEDQKEILNKQINLFRYVYNWGLVKANEYYDTYNEYIGISRLFNMLSEYRNHNEWLQDIPLHSARLALMHLDKAFLMFFKHNKNKPRFKSKKYSKKCIHYRNESYAFNLSENSVRIPGFKRGERIECKSHNIPLDKEYYSCTITFDGIDYWLSTNIKMNIESFNDDILEDTETSEFSLGIDLGIKIYAQLSNGISYNPPNKIKTLTKRYRTEQSRLDRMKNRRKETAKRTKTKFEDIPLTKNEQKLKEKHLKTSIKLKNTKKSFIHQTTADIVDMSPTRIVLKDLPIIDSIHKPRNNIDEVYHSMWYKFREIMTYKANRNGIEIVLADKHFPSSQICSNCGARRKSSGRSRQYICHECGLEIDRDLNAAINLSRYSA